MSNSKATKISRAFLTYVSSLLTIKLTMLTKQPLTTITKVMTKIVIQLFVLRTATSLVMTISRVVA